LRIGLVGLPLTGKTTLFNLLTGSRAETGAFSGKTETNIGVARVPDRRVDFLSKLFKPKKTTYAQIEFVDVAGLPVGEEGQKSGAAKFLNDVRACDALVHVLRAFSNREVVHAAGEINPAMDLETVEMELLFADLELIEKRMVRIQNGKKITRENAAELELLRKCYGFLETGISMREADLGAEDKLALRNYGFLTDKPRLAVVNLDEQQFRSKEYIQQDELGTMCRGKNIPLLEVCAGMELEISELAEEDKRVFMDDLGIRQTGIEMLARAVYELLGLISFFTVGEDEVKAWTIARGLSAREAAGKIHSDLERGFIRAEVVRYSDLEELGTMARVKEKGLFRLEGKDYRVADGDIMHIRFNV